MVLVLIAVQYSLAVASLFGSDASLLRGSKTNENEVRVEIFLNPDSHR